MDEQHFAAICRLFDLGTPIRQPYAVAGGLTNRLWRLETSRGVFAVKHMNRDFDRVDYVDWFDRAFKLEQAAFAASVPMPRPVPVAATGRCLGQLPDGGDGPVTVRAHEWVDGEPLVNGRVYPPDVVSRVAVTVAGLHKLSMPADISARAALRVFGADFWRELADRLDAEGVELAAQFRALLPALADLESYVAAAHDDPTPLLLSHRDSDQKNFMQTSGGELLLVDWDAAGPVNPRHDVANNAMVWAGVHVDEPDARTVATFVDAYRSAADMDPGFRDNDLAELVALRLGWFEFNAHRALGERTRDDSDRVSGLNVIRRNTVQLPRFARSLERWLALLRG